MLLRAGDDEPVGGVEGAASRHAIHEARLEEDADHAERLVFLRVTVRDADGEVLMQSGDLDPNGDLILGSGQVNFRYEPLLAPRYFDDYACPTRVSG